MKKGAFFTPDFHLSPQEGGEEDARVKTKIELRLTLPHETAKVEAFGSCLVHGTNFKHRGSPRVCTYEHSAQFGLKVVEFGILSQRKKSFTDGFDL